jgi:hypothetical protein
MNAIAMAASLGFVGGCVAVLAVTLPLKLRRQKRMSETTSKIIAAVHRIETVADGLIMQNRNLAQAIRDNAGDVDALNALASEIDAKAGEMAAAIVANTVAAPVAHANSEPVISASNGGDLGALAAPAPVDTNVAVISTDPAHGGSAETPVIITHDDEGTVLTTPVESGRVDANTIVVVTPEGVPVVSADLAVLGPTDEAPAGTLAPTDPEHVANELVSPLSVQVA